MTDSIGLGIAVIVLPLRNPLLLARELASIDRLSGGRLTVGVGLGAGDEERAARLGFPAGRPVRRLVENVEILRAAWTQPEASFDGELYRFAGRAARAQAGCSSRTRRSGSAPAPSEPCAARSASATAGSARAPRRSTTSSPQSATVREALAAAAAATPTRFPIAKRVYVAVGDGKRLQEGLDAMYSWPGLGARVAVVGLTRPDRRAARAAARSRSPGAPAAPAARPLRAARGARRSGRPQGLSARSGTRTRKPFRAGAFEAPMFASFIIRAAPRTCYGGKLCQLCSNGCG